MGNPNPISNFELMVMLALIRLGDEAYGVPIAKKSKAIAVMTSHWAAFMPPFERLQDRGLVSSRVGEPTAERGGRAKRYFKVTGKGMTVVRETQKDAYEPWQGLPRLQGKRT